MPIQTVHPKSALPARVLACYYTSWDTGTLKVTDVPSKFNVIYLFHAKPDGTRNSTSEAATPGGGR